MRCRAAERRGSDAGARRGLLETPPRDEPSGPCRTTVLVQKTARQPDASISTPPSTGARTTSRTAMNDTRAITFGDSVSPNTSWMTARAVTNATELDPAWSTRPTMSAPIVGASAAPRAPDQVEVEAAEQHRAPAEAIGDRPRQDRRDRRGEDREAQAQLHRAHRRAEVRHDPRQTRLEDVERERSDGRDAEEEQAKPERLALEARRGARLISGSALAALGFGKTHRSPMGERLPKSGRRRPALGAVISRCATWMSSRLSARCAIRWWLPRSSARRTRCSPR